MGFFSRLPIPRGMRRATHPEHAVTQAAAPEAVEVANGAPHPAVAAAHVSAVLGGGRRRAGGERQHRRLASRQLQGQPPEPGSRGEVP